MKVSIRTETTEFEFYEAVTQVVITSTAEQRLVVTESDEGALWTETARYARWILDNEKGEK